MALCDAFHAPVGSIDRLTGDADALEAYRDTFSSYVEHDPFQDQDCGACTDFYGSSQKPTLSHPVVFDSTQSNYSASRRMITRLGVTASAARRAYQ